MPIAYTPASGSGSTPGATILRGPFPFAFNTPNLNNGVAFYTPTVGDWLLDIFLVNPTAWDGTTPFIDIFQSANSPGIFANTIVTLNRMNADVEFTWGGLSSNGGVVLSNVQPVRFTSTSPLRVCVSQDGHIGGTAIGATHGTASLYLLTSTPVAA